MIAADKIRKNFIIFQAEVNLENAEIFPYFIAADSDIKRRRVGVSLTATPTFIAGLTAPNDNGANQTGLARYLSNPMQ